MAIKAIALDFDGLILDTETASYLSFREICQEYGHDMPLAVWREWAGGIRTWPLACEYLEELLGKSVDREELHRHHRAIYNEMIAEWDVLPGVREVLDTAGRLGLKVALASSASAAWAVNHVKRYGLLDYFDFLQTRDNVTKVKPDPEIYLKAVDGLGVRADETIAFEDSVVGTQAAKAAGLYCVAVPNHVTANCSFDHVDIRLSSLLDMGLEDIIHTLEKGNPVPQESDI